MWNILLLLMIQSYAGEMTVKTQPEGAEIQIDSLVPSQHVTPVMKLQAEDGTHRLLIRKEGFEPYEEIIRVKAGVPNEIQVTLKRLDAEELGMRSGLERKLNSPWIISIFDVHESFAVLGSGNHSAVNLALGASFEKKLWSVFGIRGRYYYLPILLMGKSDDYIKTSGWRVGVPLYLVTWRSQESLERAGEQPLITEKSTSLYLMPETGKGKVDYGLKTGKTVSPKRLDKPSILGAYFGIQHYTLERSSSVGGGFQAEFGWSRFSSAISDYGVNLSVLIIF